MRSTYREESVVSRSIKIAPPNSLVLLSDEEGGMIPETMEQSLVAATSSCIAIGCKWEADGETEFILGLMSEVDPHTAPAFQGMLDTQAPNVVVRSVVGERLLELSVSRTQTRVRI